MVTTRSSASASAAQRSIFTHTPSSFTLLWLALSLPLVIWDTGYVLGRPHTMHGGRAHWPLWLPYKLYGEVDYVYGWKAILDKNGFTAAQSTLNVVETVLYLAYLWLWRSRGSREGGDAAAAAAAPGGREGRGAWVVRGRVGALALLVGFSAAVMTLSKTLLYWCNEYFSGFENVGHNEFVDLLLMWILPNGAWLVGPAYMIWSMGSEILDKLEHPAHVKRE
ncbi:hypothetical protein E4U57_001478 [Claviceps arundinis]|uniref:C6 transcription factor n=1 Tax=Claviceps arundinis TaxID=1623583 RepID=A0A9P7MPD4_9HYPO|nr:hypothetical protein E4U57_001478 [Claviceps arundinis]KAG5964387.1 hypothetical protein E4U56_002305 [Claviceps arundinis]